MNWKDHRFAMIALGVWLVLAVHTTASTSVTHDEIWHLPAGLRGWDGDFKADRLNPPISRLWAALPVRLAGVTADEGVDGSSLSEKFVAENADYLRWYIVGRRANLIWPFLTAVLIYIWSCAASGLPAARFGLVCFLACPNVIAHGSLVTPDAAAMCCFFATSFLLARWMATPTWRTAIGLGIVTGLLQGTKFTGVVLLPVILAAGTWTIWRGIPSAGKSKGRWRLVAQLLAVIAVSLVVLCGVYGFQSCGFRLDALALNSGHMQAWRSRVGFLSGLPMPLPADYVLGVDEQMRIMESKHPLFLDGVWQESGFPSYYARALGYKLSHGFQLACLAGLWVACKNLKRVQWRQAFALWCPLAILFAIASFSDMQLGLRYILPIVPALAMLAGRSADLVAAWNPIGRRIAMAAMLLALLSPLRFHPHHLAYFNEYAGGPVGGRYHLIDSNLDWGQDLLRAREFIQAHAGEQPRFLYFGTVNPRDVGIEVPLPPSRRLAPGLYVVSVNFVMGRPHAILLPDRTRRSVDVHEFSYFRLFQPVARCGYSIDVYRITAEDIRRAANEPRRK